MSTRTLRTALLPPALAITFAALLCAVALLISGSNPLTALAAMVTQVGQGTTAVDIVTVETKPIEQASEFIATL